MCHFCQSWVCWEKTSYRQYAPTSFSPVLKCYLLLLPLSLISTAPQPFENTDAGAVVLPFPTMRVSSLLHVLLQLGLSREHTLPKSVLLINNLKTDLTLKPFCSSSRSKMSRGCGSPKRRLGHQDDYQLAEVLSQVALQVTPAPSGQRSSGLIQVKSGLLCQMLTSGCWKGQSDKGFGKRSGFFGGGRNMPVVETPHPLGKAV